MGLERESEQLINMAFLLGQRVGMKFSYYKDILATYTALPGKRSVGSNKYILETMSQDAMNMWSELSKHRLYRASYKGCTYYFTSKEMEAFITETDANQRYIDNKEDVFRLIFATAHDHKRAVTAIGQSTANVVEANFQFLKQGSAVPCFFNYVNLLNMRVKNYQGEIFATSVNLRHALAQSGDYFIEVITFDQHLEAIEVFGQEDIALNNDTELESQYNKTFSADDASLFPLDNEFGDDILDSDNGVVDYSLLVNLFEE